MRVILLAGAVIGGIALVVFLVMVAGLLPPQTIRLVEGYMPMQLLAELAFFVAVFTVISYLLKKNGLGIPRFWQGISFWLFIILYLKYRIYPPIPFSVRAIYGTIAMVGVFMWMSGAEDDWKEFKKPILNVLDAATPFHKALRTFYLIAIPIILWGFSYNSFLPNLDEPIELRTAHPAPPASTKVHGKTFVLQTASNPYRSEEHTSELQSQSNLVCRLLLEKK